MFYFTSRKVLSLIPEDFRVTFGRSREPAMLGFHAHGKNNVEKINWPFLAGTYFMKEGAKHFQARCKLAFSDYI